MTIPKTDKFVVSEDKKEFESLLDEELGLSFDLIEKLSWFRELALDENKRQNLTRQTSARDFFDGHVMDAYHLLKSGFLSFQAGPAMDFGSGMGSPGILAAVLDKSPEKPWVLVESEEKKALFIRKAAKELDLSQVEAVKIRGDAYLKLKEVDSIVAKAVGKIAQFDRWLGNCSTWNNLILMKAKSWGEEWDQYQKRSDRVFELVEQYDYSVGTEKIQRKLVLLKRRQ